MEGEQFSLPKKCVIVYPRVELEEEEVRGGAGGGVFGDFVGHESGRGAAEVERWSRGGELNLGFQANPQRSYEALWGSCLE